MATPRTSEELKQIALDFVAGKIYTDRQIKDPNDVPLVFLPLALMSKEDIERTLVKDKVALIFEYMSAASARSAGEHPSFMSFRTVDEDELKKIKGYVDAIRVAVKTLPD